MRALVQRVSRASVVVEEEVTSKIELGLVVMVGVSKYDLEEDPVYISDKVLNLRIFPNASGKFDRSVLDVHGRQ